MLHTLLSQNFLLTASINCAYKSIWLLEKSTLLSCRCQVGGVVRRKKERRELYGTREVAAILGIPDWRVKNFSEGEAYRLPPSIRVGSGRGSRRLSGWTDIFRIGLADRLVKFGFTPETVGEAVREIPESLLTPYQAMLYARPEPKLSKKETPILVNSGGQWQVKRAIEVQRTLSQTLEHEGSSRGLFIVNLANVFDAIFSDLHRYWTGMTKEEIEAGLKGG